MSTPPPAPPAERTLAAWLDYLERLHPSTIDLGLDRVRTVAQRMHLRFSCPVITVGGTNGKGSTCALLEAILRAAGYRVGCYTSPHLLRYNERVRLDGVEAADAELVAAFECVEEARQGVSLTYFEFGTLAAASMFRDAQVDAAVLEVGLGGRLDAVNLFDADCAVITSIGLDHLDYLGPTREHVGFEKAGIFRGGRPAIVAEADPPHTVIDQAAGVGAQLFLIDRDFGARASEASWTYWSWLGRRSGLPWPALRGAYQLGNASAALAALECLRERLPIDMGAVRRGLVEVELPGRFQVWPGQPAIVLDVAHNPQAAERLAENLRRMHVRGRTFAVFGMLKDKDVEGVVRATASQIDQWFLSPLPGVRGADLARLQGALSAASADAQGSAHHDVQSAFRAARERAGPDDRIVVFGSFLTVGAVSQLLMPGRRAA